MGIRSKMNACVLAVALLGTPLLGHTAGFGKMTVLSNLGQPFRAEIDLVPGTQPEEKGSLVVRLASQDTFQDRGVELSSVVRSMRFELASRSDGSTYIRVSSSQPVNDPYVDFLVELSWPGGRVTREYTDLVDPSNYSATTAGKSTVVTVPQVSAQSPASVAPRVARAEVTATPLPAAKPSSGIRHRRPLMRAAPAPRRSVSAKSGGNAESSSSEPSKVGVQHKVKPGETLGQIAGRYRSGHVSLDQMLDGLYRDNADAFINQNINRLKTGSILRVPSAIEASAIPLADAEHEIKAHTADFGKYAQSVAASVAAAPTVKSSSGSTSTGGQVKARAEDASKRGQNGPTDVAILTSGKNGGKASKADQQRAREEDSSANANEAKENATKVKLLEQQVHDLQDLLAKLKSEKSAPAGGSASGKEVPLPVVAPPPPVAHVAPPAPVKPSVAVVTPKPTASAAKPVMVAAKPAASKVEAKVASPAVAPVQHHKHEATETLASAATPVSSEAAPVKHHATQPPVPEAPEEETFSSNLLIAGAGAAVVILLGTIFFMRRRRARPSFEDSVLTGGDLKSNSVLGSVGGSIVDTSSTTDNSFFTDFSREGLGTIDTDEVDPVAEAEVYMAYGRDAQAEEILKDALIKDSTRQEVRLKLLEIYANRKNLPNFELYASELHSATGGHGPLWDKASAMGRELDPANSLYGMTESALDSVVVKSPDSTLKMNAVLESQPVTEAEADLDFELGTVRFDAAAIQAQMAAIGAPKMEQIDEPNPVDLDVPAGDSMSELDFNLPQQEKTSPAVQEPEPEAVLADADASADDDADSILDFQFDLGGPEPTEAAVAPDLQFSNTMGFHVKPVDEDVSPMSELDIGEPVADLQPSADVEPSMGQDDTANDGPLLEHEPIKLDLDELNLDLNVDADADETVEIAPKPDEGFQLDDFDATDLSAADDPVETKLDLAKAYIEMGDREGAREILTEAVGEGTDQQRQRAHAMLAQL